MCFYFGGNLYYWIISVLSKKERWNCILQSLKLSENYLEIQRIQIYFHCLQSLSHIIMSCLLCLMSIGPLFCRHRAMMSRKCLPNVIKIPVSYFPMFGLLKFLILALLISDDSCQVISPTRYLFPFVFCVIFLYFLLLILYL